jgi:hypothetical protein
MRNQYVGGKIIFKKFKKYSEFLDQLNTINFTRKHLHHGGWLIDDINKLGSTLIVLKEEFQLDDFVLHTSHISSAMKML